MYNVQIKNKHKSKYMCLPIFRRTLGILMIAFMLCACGVFSIMQTSAANTFTYQVKILDKSGNPVTSQLIMTISLWTTATRGTNDYKTDKTVDTSATGYVYHGSYTVTPTSFGVVTIEVGSGAYPLPDPLPNTDMYMDVQIRKASEGTDKNDLMDNRNKASGALSAVTSQLNAGLGGVSGANLIIYDSSTGEFRGSKSVDMSTTNVKLSFGSDLTKKVLTEWDATNSWWVLPNKMNFTGGLYLNGVDITTLLGGSAALAQYVGVTATTSGNAGGYNAANALCAAAYAGSHVCTAEEMSYSNRVNPTGVSGVTAWIVEQAPGYTSNSNDCQGLTSANASHLGAYYVGDSNGGKYWLTSCSRTDLPAIVLPIKR